MAIINITVDTTTDSTEFLAALFGVLAGREFRPGGPMPELAVAPVARPMPTTPQEAADALMAHAVATRAPVPLPPVADEQDEEGDEASPTQFDLSGIPWDARIHSTPPKINKTGGLWRAKRGVDEVTFGQVVGELQEKYAGNPPTGTPKAAGLIDLGGIAPTPPASAPSPSIPSATPVAPPPAADGAPSAGSPAVETAPLAPAAPAAPPPTPAANAPTAPAAPTVAADASGAGRFPNFAAFVQAVSAIRSPAIPYLELNDIAGQCGVSAFKDMKDHPDLFETFYGLAGGQ